MDAFCNAMSTTGKELLTREESADPGWFEASRDHLMPLINERNRILLAARSSDDQSSVPTWKRKCIDARNNVRDAVRLAKSR